MNAITIREWAIDVLKLLAKNAQVPESNTVTEEHILALVVWAHKEGGGVTVGENTSPATFNPLNTKFSSGSITSTSVGGPNVYKNESYTRRHMGRMKTAL
jgi:hypothetical protein